MLIFSSGGYGISGIIFSYRKKNKTNCFLYFTYVLTIIFSYILH